MKLEDYSIDDLHVCALNEFDNDEDSQRQLNAAYQAAKTNYIALQHPAHLQE